RITNGDGACGCFFCGRDSQPRHNARKIQTRRLESRQPLPFGESSGASHVCAQRKICERAPRGLRNSIALATRSRTFARVGASSRAAVATGLADATTKVG